MFWTREQAVLHTTCITNCTEIGKKAWLFAKLYSQAEPGRELTQPSPRLLAEPCTYGAIFQTIDRDIVNTKEVSKIDVCSGSVIVFKFTRFEVYCSLKYQWYPFDTQVSKKCYYSNRYGNTICKAQSQCYRYVPSLSYYTTWTLTLLVDSEWTCRGGIEIRIEYSKQPIGQRLVNNPTQTGTPQFSFTEQMQIAMIVSPRRSLWILDLRFYIVVETFTWMVTNNIYFNSGDLWATWYKLSCPHWW